MPIQMESTPGPNKSKANSHSQNADAIASSIPIQVTGQDMEPLTDEQRRELIAVAAYYLAERRNFEPGHETEDWLAAESQVRSLTALRS
ncbi:MAG: DUF2934 domain-containing protein [Steroidobacteraceae bacterium]